ncbi:hypothetical protein CJF30_00001649 [Rutstroemia sp. NJR-2017a BBW]|nr:hypothetical protein CJF30_00001649 [Rutstroemia sp. NJR-2017a BBW]
MADKFTQNCYAYVNGGVETLDREKGYFPCGTVNSTSDDTCVGNNICKASTADLSTETDYYFGYCNDPTYTSSACNTQCLDLRADPNHQSISKETEAVQLASHTTIHFQNGHAAATQHARPSVTMSLMLRLLPLF